MSENIVLKNRHFTLVISDRCIPKSLTINKTGEECLYNVDNLPLFSITENRPYNNEIKLAHLNKRTVFSANEVRAENNLLIVGFEIIKFKAVIEIIEADDYIAFKFKDFIVKPEDFSLNSIKIPVPAAELRILQLPIKNRSRFGEWSNIAWDDQAAVGVMSANYFTRTDSEKRRDFRILYSEALREVKLRESCTVLIACEKENILTCIDAFEKAFDLPHGVESRKNRRAVNSSVLWTCEITPNNAEEIISYAKSAGFTKILIYYTAFIREEGGYIENGNYVFNDKYPNGISDLKAVLDKIKASGINPGFHFLQTHIGVKSRYVTPNADHRLNLTRYFTLAAPLSESDDVIYVEQNPEGAPTDPALGILKFGTEIISYDAFVEQPPYRFIGCKRGCFDTTVKAHELGTIGGVLDVSEFGGNSVYIDQRTGLQDEIAQKIADIYNGAGFEFAYFDGSEGTNPPFEIYIPYAQYRVYRLFDKKPLFCEGAAKSHFSWHMLSGGNAFDVFPTNIFKKMIAQYPLEEALRMTDDFTRVNFGWWRYRNDTMPDILEYGTSKAASMDCPATIIANICDFKSNPRTKDNLEVMRRWEYVRENDLLSSEQKKTISNPNREFTLLLSEKGEYEPVEYFELETPDEISAFYFEYKEKTYVTFWHKYGEGKLRISLDKTHISLKKELFSSPSDLREYDGDNVIIPIGEKMYLECNLARQKVKKAFKTSIII